MPALQFLLTTAGKNAIVNANNTGTNPITIAKVGIGSASWTPTVSATALNTEIKKITTIGGGAVADDTIHVTASDTSTDVYTVREIGLFTSDNILVAVYSQADPIITKGAGTVALIAADLVITGIPAGSVTVGDATFDYPQASTTVKGVAEIATNAEAQAGTDTERIITPAGLQSVTATETRKGVIELATNAEVQAGTDTSRAVTPASLNACTATTTRSGVIELATNVEVQTGTDAERAVTPATLNACTATTVRTGVIALATDAEVQAGTNATKAVTPSTLKDCTATTSRRGVVELATNAEAQAQTDSTRAITPANLAILKDVCKAWVSFTGTGTPTRNSYHNVSGITDLGVGKYRVTFINPMGNSSYCALGSAETSDVGLDGDRDCLVTFSPITTGAHITLWVNDPTGNTRTDPPAVFVVIFSDANL